MSMLKVFVLQHIHSYDSSFRRCTSCSERWEAMPSKYHSSYSKAFPGVLCWNWLDTATAADLKRNAAACELGLVYHGGFSPRSKPRRALLYDSYTSYIQAEEPLEVYTEQRCLNGGWNSGSRQGYFPMVECPSDRHPLQSLQIY